MNDKPENAIAIVALNGRFPGAQNVEEFWDNLKNGVESVSFFTDEELKNQGLASNLLTTHSAVRADALLDNIDLFDADFFDFSPREAEVMDPQHRLFLEAAWEVMEKAGYTAEKYDGKIGIYGGSNLSGYMVRNLYTNPGLVDELGTFKTMLSNGQDFFVTRVSYKMNFTGPSVNVNTLCSSSLVAVHMAAESLLNYQCDLALAGGANIQVSRNESFFYQEGGIGASDGHCRAYDAQANGTVSGSGLTVVVLKRLEDALNDGDQIRGIILGSAINNDGAFKNSYTAPNADGQAECVTEAIEMAGINPETISYIEGHGTGTNLGDPIEVSGLTKAFRAYTEKKQFCALGSVKTNIGHLVTAGGVASLIKTVLAMENGYLPASLNFEKPNPKIDFDNSPFFVNKTGRTWRGTQDLPLRAGVSSFGIGGTNAHVIVQQSPGQRVSDEGKSHKLFCLSAKTEAALETMCLNLKNHCIANPNLKPADIAYTLHRGRRDFNHKRFFTAAGREEIIEKLGSTSKVMTKFGKPKEIATALVFPGNLGEEELKALMAFAKELAAEEKAFKDALDECGGSLGLVSIEIALAKLLLSWGLDIACVAGDGDGEYAAACIAGILAPKDACLLANADQASVNSAAQKIAYGDMEIDMISSLSGEVLSEAELSASYFTGAKTRAGMEKAASYFAQDKDMLLMAVGPAARSLSGFEAARLLVTVRSGEHAVQSLAHAAGEYWLHGGKIDWMGFYQNQERNRVELPTYPFERKRYWIEPGTGHAAEKQPDIVLTDKEIGINEKKISKGSMAIHFDFQNGIVQDDTASMLLALKKDIEELCKARLQGTNYGVNIPGIGIYTGETGQGSIHKLKKNPRPNLETPFAAPETTIQKNICRFFEDELGIDQVGVHDDFYALGGHSLKAASIVSKIQQDYEIDIKLSDIFQHPTVHELSQLVANSEKKGYHSVVPAPKKDHYRLSASQRRFWHDMQLEDFNMSNTNVVLVIQGTPDLAKFERCLAALIRRHEILRTSFLTVDGEPFQKVHDSVDFTLELFETTEEGAFELVKNYIRRFDLSKAPLIRSALFKTGDAKYYWVIDMDHIVSDGSSVAILMRDFVAIYNEIALPPMELHYKDYAEWQHGFFASSEMGKQLGFWRKQLEGGMPIVLLPYDFEWNDMGKTGAQLYSQTIALDLAERLNALVKGANATLNALFFSLFAALLQRYTDQERIVIGSVVAGRSKPDFENIAGVFASALPIVIGMKAGNTFAELFEATKSVLMESYNNQDLTYDQIVTEGYFTTALNFHNELSGDQREMRLDGLKISEFDYKERPAIVHLNLDVHLVPSGEFVLEFVYAGQKFKEETIRQLMDNFMKLIRQVVEKPSTKLTDIELLSLQEKQEIKQRREKFKIRF